MPLISHCHRIIISTENINVYKNQMPSLQVQWTYRTFRIPIIKLNKLWLWWKMMILSRSLEQFHSNGRSNPDYLYPIITTCWNLPHWSSDHRHSAPTSYLPWSLGHGPSGQVLRSGLKDGGLRNHLPNLRLWLHRVVFSRHF
jgi:hypothetical protein